jgi:hypothetical protein
MILSSDYVKVRIRKGATYSAVLSVKAAARQSVSQSLREFLLDWDGILMLGTGHSLNENRTRMFEALV